MERCNYELIVEEYFGVKYDKETDEINSDFGQLVNLVCFAIEKTKTDEKEIWEAIGYQQGYSDAVKEARQEIKQHYHPNK